MSLANLSLRSLVALAVASSPSLGVSDLGAGFSIISSGSSSITSGLTFSLTATAIRNCTNQTLNCHAGSRLADAETFSVLISVGFFELRFLLAAPCDILRGYLG